MHPRISQRHVNLFSTISILVFSTLSNLYLTPFFIEYAGIEGLAVIRVAYTIPLYVGLISLALMASFSRFFVVALQENSESTEEASSVISTGLFSLLVFFTVLLIPVFVLCFYLLDGISNTANQMYFHMYLYTAISTLAVIFTLPYYAINRQGTYNFNKILCLLLQTLLIIIWFPRENEFSVIGLSFFISSIASLLYSLYVFRSYQASSTIKVSISYFNLSKLKAMLNMSKWTFIESSGALLLFTVDLLLVVYLLGEVMGGQYSIYVQLFTAFLVISKALGGVFAPEILALYAKKELKDLNKLITRSVLFIGVAMTLPMAYVAAFPEFVLTLWLNTPYELVNKVIGYSFIIAPVALCTSVLPYFFSAHLKIKVPAIATLILGTIHLAIIYIAASYFENSIFIIAASLLLILLIKNIGFYIFYSTLISGFNQINMIKAIIFIFVLTISMNLCYRLLINYLNYDSSLMLILIGIIFSFIACIISFIFDKKILRGNS